MKYLQWYPKLSNLSETAKTKLGASLSQAGDKIRKLDLTGTYKIYDKLTGLDHVRAAHTVVTEAEESFVKSQVARRKHQLDVFKLEEAKSRINAQLDTVNRSDEGFLRLVTELHELSRQHKDAKQLLASAELAEQVTFEQFSGALRHSQAEERLQANRMRQWSIGFSLLAGFIGFGATWVRFRTLESSKAQTDYLLPAGVVSGQLSSTSMASLNTVVESLNKNLQRIGQDLEAIRVELRESILRLQNELNHGRESTPIQKLDEEEQFSSTSTKTMLLLSSGALVALVLLLSSR